jgi:Lrp/AsnC family leucine-responsive transcriptional regulator
MDLDRFDRQLLNLVQADSGQTAERLAEQGELSPSAIQRRLRRLREEGVILGDCAIVDPSTVGRPDFFVVALHVEREKADLLAQLRKWLAAEDSVQQVFYVVGEADFILIVTCPHTEAYDAFTSRMMRENPNVRRFNTHVALSVLKRGLSIPIAPLSDASTSQVAE